MAYARTRTIIPLARVAEYFQIDPWHFHQVYTDTRPDVPSCDDMWFQHAEQSAGRLSREQLAQALAQAEKMVVRYLGWYPMPQWVVEEEQILPTYHARERYNFYNSRLQPKSLTTKYGYVMEVGLLTKTVVEAGVITVFSDEDGDGLDETVTITVSTDLGGGVIITDEEELRVYYPGKAADDRFEIRPLTDIAIDTTTNIATITFPKYLIPLENLVEYIDDPGNNKSGICGDDNANFLATVDVYRVYSDPSQQVTFQTENVNVCNTGVSACAFHEADGCLTIRDGENGILAYQRAEWDSDNEIWVATSFTYAPKKAIINYRAGLQDNNLKWPTRMMDSLWERLIIFYASSLVDTKLCGCSNTSNIWEKQTLDVAKVTSDVSYSYLWNTLDNPLGTTVAAIRLWKHLNSAGVRREIAPHT